MEELAENFSNHIGKLISKKLGEQITKSVSQNLSSNSIDTYQQIEYIVKSQMEYFLNGLGDKELTEVAKNIFNTFVEKDDDNLIKAIKIFVRTYGFYHNMLLKRKLFQWRINANKRRVKMRSITNNKKNTSLYYVTNQEMSLVQQEKKDNPNIHNKLYKNGINKKNDADFNEELKELKDINQRRPGTKKTRK